MIENSQMMMTCAWTQSWFAKSRTCDRIDGNYRRKCIATVWQAKTDKSCSDGAQIGFHPSLAENRIMVLLYLHCRKVKSKFMLDDEHMLNEISSADSIHATVALE